MAFFSAKDIPGENSFAPAKYGFIGIKGDEVIFVELDKNVEFYGQPCGVIIAKTMALANSAAAHVEIVYEKSLEQRPIIPSIREWCEQNKPSRNIAEFEEFILPPNQEQEFEILGGEKKIQGIRIQLQIK